MLCLLVTGRMVTHIFTSGPLSQAYAVEYLLALNVQHQALKSSVLQALDQQSICRTGSSSSNLHAILTHGTPASQAPFITTTSYRQKHH